MKQRQIWIFLGLMLGLTLITNLARQVWGYPETFDYSFSGTGVIESLEPTGSRCQVKLALYDWLNLSADFPRQTIPARNDRFLVTANKDACNAIQVARTATGKHIAFEIGQTKNTWFFSTLPSPGSGCGGLELDWQPEPENKS